MSLINARIPQIGESSSKTPHMSTSIHLEDISEDHLLYEQLQSFISAKQADLFASVTKENSAERQQYEKLENRANSSNGKFSNMETK